MKDLIGSSQGLLEECLILTQRLNVPANLDPESDAIRTLFAAPAQNSEWQRYAREVHCCLQLIRACRKSIETGAAIVLH